MSNASILNSLSMVISPGTVFVNPGGGTSEIVGITEKNIYYIRGKSKISFPVHEFIEICSVFEGQKCSSSDLKKRNPKIFDSNKSGHSCNCTFLFCLAEKLGLLNNGIQGRGVSGNPFYVVFK